MSKRKEMIKVENTGIEKTQERPTIPFPVDIYESKNEVLVIADIPGVSSENMSLNFENNQLVIRASVNISNIEGTALFQEFSEVDYRRAFQLASGIDSQKISANLAGGTLKIHLPKSEALKPQQIPITSG